MGDKKAAKAVRGKRFPLGQNPVKGPKVDKKVVKFANGVTVTIAHVHKKGQ